MFYKRRVNTHISRGNRKKKLKILPSESYWDRVIISLCKGSLPWKSYKGMDIGQVCVQWFTCYEGEGNQKGGEEKNWEIWANHLHFSLFTCFSCQGISYAGCLFSQIIRGALPQKQPLFTSPCQYLCHLVTTLYSHIAWKHIVAWTLTLKVVINTSSSWFRWWWISRCQRTSLEKMALLLMVLAFIDVVWCGSFIDVVCSASEAQLSRSDGDCKAANCGSDRPENSYRSCYCV